MPENVSLTAIANEEGTDKGTVGPVDTWPGHNYTDIYDAYLHPFRREPITLLEIGLGVRGPEWDSKIAQGRNVHGGASIRMWYRYFPRATIFGIDVNPAGFLDNDRVTTGVADQGDPEQLRRFVHEAGLSRIDVIVDDGSHRADHQQTTFSALLPYLAPGGLYFIEDLLDNGMRNTTLGGSAGNVLSTREVLRGFARSGAFPEPNAIERPEELAQQIARVSFHCPALRSQPVESLRNRLLASARLLMRSPMGPSAYVTGKEQLCVITKAGDWGASQEAPRR